MSWIRSTHCTGPWQTLTNETPLFDRIQEWVAYVVFAECPQHSIISIINLAFLAIASSTVLYSLAILFKRNYSGAISYGNTKRQVLSTIVGFLLPMSTTVCLTTLSIGIAAFGIWDGIHYGWSSPYIREEVFSAIEALAWLSSLIILLSEKKGHLQEHPLTLRTWWFFSFLTSFFAFLSSLFRLTAAFGLSYNLQLIVYDIYAIVKLPATLSLFIAALKGETGIQENNLAAGTVGGSLREPLLATAATSSFAKAGFWSKLTFTWLTPLLQAGSKRSLEQADVPQLAPNDRAENLCKLFQSSWEKSLNSAHPLISTLTKCFWPQMLLCAFLQFVRSVAMFGGPLLISSFTDFVSGDRVSRYDGYALVLILLTAKSIEVFSYHQYNFHCYKLGNNIRSAVVTSLYRKGLCLSSSARMSHGVGQITNYMVVDAQQLQDAVIQANNMWSMPLQIILALSILYLVIGVGSLAGLATMVLVAALAMCVSSKQRSFQEGVMRGRDGRMKAINEALHYMKVVKLQAWEEFFQKKIEKQRQKEYSALKKFVIAAATNMFNLWNTQPLVCNVTYVTAICLGRILTTASLFTAASLFRILQEPIRNFPNSVNQVIQALVALDRIERYLQSTEIQKEAVTRVLELDEHPVVIDRGCFSWDDVEGTLVLKEINLNIKRGSLVTIVGTVGSGKSSLLSAMLGEMVKITGNVKMSGIIAYVPQTAWIQNATIEENILFGTAMEHVRYRQVLKACALEQDLAAMEHGDQTEIGEKGINLSGGQKQRIQLARAVYQDCDVYLLDDVFSAVDAHTGAHLFKECILGLLQGKTVLLVTHQVEFLTGADVVLVMKDGKIAQSGKYNEILSIGTELGALVAAHNQAMDLMAKDAPKKSENGHVEQFTTEMQERLSFERLISTEELVLSLPVSTEGLIETLSSTDTFIDFNKAEGSTKLIEEEQREVGQVSMKIYWLYFTKAYGWSAVMILLANQVMWQTLLVGSDFWLADEIPNGPTSTVNTRTFIVVYTALNLISFVNVLIRVVLVAVVGLKTAQGFFLEMLRGIFRAPMYFFDTTPSGRILSRFSADQTNLDFIIHYFLGGFMGSVFGLFGVIVVICISSWPIIFMVIPFLFLFHVYQVFYINSSREITRLDSITKAPLIYHFSETVAGIDTVRCFGKAEEFSQKNLDQVNDNMKMDFHNNSATEWLGLRLESLGTAILCMTAFLFVALPSSSIRPELVSLALSYALGLNTSLYWSTWLYCTVENRMISVERMQQFTDIPSEASRVIEDCLPSPNWPYAGKIVAKRLKLRYRQNTPLVLKGVNFTIQGGHKVGVVGRTGSGKSTLIQAIFRLVEPTSGQILVDGVDISTLGLYDLRSRFGIIPQEPVLFEGTIRMNVDPLGLYTDEDIWKGLHKCQLANIVQDRPDKLDAQVTEYGGNWSVGQSQLLCFVRVLLKGSKVLFLDEATASVDSQTDAVIQNLIRKEFAHCTVVSIAHRIPTVMDADKVLVMDAGKVKEFDTPQNLLGDPNSIFSALVHEYHTRSGQRD